MHNDEIRNDGQIFCIILNEYNFNNMNGHRHSNNLTTRYYWKVQKKKITPRLVIMVNFYWRRTWSSSKHQKPDSHWCRAGCNCLRHGPSNKSSCLPISSSALFMAYFIPVIFLSLFRRWCIVNWNKIPAISTSTLILMTQAFEFPRNKG